MGTTYKGVYTYNRKGFEYYSKVWNSSSDQTTVGHYHTEEEARYERLLKINGHHWEGAERLTDKHFGFIYKLTNLVSGKMYIGSKQLYFWDGPVGGYKQTNPSLKDWDPKAWRVSDWETYTTSSKDINAEERYNFSYEILEGYQDKLELHLGEIKYQRNHDVLGALDKSGNFQYYNRNIAGMLFRPMWTRESVAMAMDDTLEEIREYYLKPRVCFKCLCVIPYKEVHTCES